MMRRVLEHGSVKILRYEMMSVGLNNNTLSSDIDDANYTEGAEMWESRRSRYYQPPHFPATAIVQ
jgi:hypothetical protein